MTGSLPATDVVDEAARWLGWWALLAGIGSVLAWAFWTEGVHHVLVGTGMMPFLLLRGRIDAEGPTQ